MPVNLTESAIKKAAKKVAETGKRLDVSDATLAGLRLRLTPASLDPLSGTWVLACRDQLGGMRRFQLGRYPAVSLSEARDAARSMREAVRKAGADPVADAKRKRKMGKDAREGIGTLTALLDLYGTKEGNKRKTWETCRKAVEHVFAAHLSKALGAVKLADLQMTADSHKAQQSAAAAVRYLRPILKWAAHVGRGYCPGELSLIRPPAVVQRRERVLMRDELSRLIPSLKASSRPYAGAMRLMLLTLTRREEVGEARWRDIDLEAGSWTIAKTKNGQPHVVPLPRQAIALLQDLLPKNREGKVLPPVAEARVFGTGTGAALGNWDRETKAIMEASKTSRWHRHDLRRTGATMLGEMGELPDLIEAALNHVAIRSPLAATYNRSRYRPQVAAALQRLADALDGIEVGAGEVVQLHNTMSR